MYVQCTLTKYRPPYTEHNIISLFHFQNSLHPLIKKGSISSFVYTSNIKHKYHTKLLLLSPVPWHHAREMKSKLYARLSPSNQKTTPREKLSSESFRTGDFPSDSEYSSCFFPLASSYKKLNRSNRRATRDDNMKTRYTHKMQWIYFTNCILDSSIETRKTRKLSMHVLDLLSNSWFNLIKSSGANWLY